MTPLEESIGMSAEARRTCQDDKDTMTASEPSMRDFRALEREFLAQARAHLNERADRRLVEIERYQSRAEYEREKLHQAYLEFLRAMYQTEESESDRKMRAAMAEADKEFADGCPF